MEKQVHGPAFPVVGIGASAGGLPALSTLLENMPPDPDMALVVALQLPSGDPDAADHSLRRATRLPVTRVAQRVRIEPGHVYVIPPGRSLRMEDGHLLVDALPRPPGGAVTIDLFFRTLAAAHGVRAVGILLSGMGADGVAGLASVKEHGGVTIVQQPDDAAERGMPQSAIDAGMADFVLPAARMPAKLCELRDLAHTIRARAARDGGPCAGAPGDAVPVSGDALKQVLALLHTATGHDFRHYKWPTIARRLERRLQVRGVSDLHAYSALLESDAQEGDALLGDLLIGVTGFFRDRQSFDALAREALPDLFRRADPNVPVRAWVAACSTGEEAYSLAMQLAEQPAAHDPMRSLQVFASDIDERAIAIARAGMYQATAALEADVGTDRLDRFFVREDRHYRVRRSLRDRILFARHNLLRDPAYSRLDLITCRNFLIYVNRDMHAQVLEMFHAALNPGGYLFLGSAESADAVPHLFTAVDARHRIYRALPVSGARRFTLAEPLTTARTVPAARPDATPAARREHRPSYAELHLRKLAQVAPPSVLVDANGQVLHASGRASGFLRYAAGEPTRDVLVLVLPHLRPHLRTLLFQAQKTGQCASAGPLRYTGDGGERRATITVTPCGDEDEAAGMLLVQFDDTDTGTGQAGPDGDGPLPAPEDLAAELLRTRRLLQHTIDQAESSGAQMRGNNDALQENVEHLHALIEECEMRHGALQSRNEELHTVNTELRMKVEETSKANDDLENLIASTDIATLFLDPALCIKRYTPHVNSLFNVLPSDVGRPLAHLTNRLDYPQLVADVEHVCATLAPVEREVRSRDGRAYIVRVHPYRTADERVEGVVMTFFDISRRRLAEEALRESEQRFRLFVTASSDTLYRISADWSEMHSLQGPDFLASTNHPSRDWLQRYIPPDDRQVVLDAIARAVAAKTVFELEHRVIRADGGIGWTFSRAIPLLDAQGNILEWFGAASDVTRRKAGEEALRAAEARYRAELEQQVRERTAELKQSRDLLQATMDASIDMIQVFEAVRDETGRIADFRWVLNNRASEQHYGDARSESLLQRNPGVVEEGIFDAFREVVETGVPRQDERHYVHEQFDGWFLQSVVKLGDGVATTTKDISAWKQSQDELLRLRDEVAQARLRESEEKYRHLIDCIPVAVYACDADGTLAYSNARAAELWGRTPAPDASPLAALLASGDAVVGRELRIERADGSAVDVLANVTPLVGSDGRVKGAISILQDITDRKHAEAALRDSEARFRALAEASPALIWQDDGRENVVYVNQRFLDVTGMRGDAMLGKGWQANLHPDDAPAYIAAAERAHRRRTVFHKRVRRRMADGSWHWFDSHARPWYADDVYRGHVGLSIDVDEAVRAEDALKQADRRKDEFLATLAHELRNPLAPISNAVRLLACAEGRQHIDRLVAMAERQVKQMVRLVDDLMEVTRITRGKIALQRGPVVLADIVHSAIETSQPALDQMRHRLTLALPDDLLMVYADRVRLTQAFANLLNNAARYTPPGGHVEVEVRRERHRVKVAVRDNGKGIPAEQLPLIFDMFSQPHGAGGRSDSGLGIGLAMVKNLVQLHGGHVGARSAGAGQGSEFVVRLPLLGVRVAADDAAGPAAGAEPLAGKTVLIVDDNRDAADTLCSLLATRGAHAQAVYGGDAVPAALEALSPDAVVLDIGMPDIDGYEVARRIRADGRFPGLRIVALTGWVQAVDRQRSQAAGFDHHLTKPADLALLETVLAGR